MPDYDPQRLKIVAFRVFSGREFIVTVYAQDRAYYEHPSRKVMVRKFKLENVSPVELLNCIGDFNTSLFLESYGNFDMEMINK